MEEARYKSRPRKGNIISNTYNSVKSYFGAIPMLGTAAGTGVGYWGALLSVSAKDFVLYRLPYLSNWEWGEIRDPLYSSLQQGYDVAGEWAIVGAIAGLVLTNKFKKVIVSLIKR